MTRLSKMHLIWTTSDCDITFLFRGAREYLLVCAREQTEELFCSDSCVKILYIKEIERASINCLELSENAESAGMLSLYTPAICCFGEWVFLNVVYICGLLFCSSRLFKVFF